MSTAILMPTQEQICIAVLWLRSNEGEGPEGEACRAVAEWIDHAAGEDFLRRQARKAGVPVAALRRKLAERGVK
jgi:hypothetical protein